MKHVTFRQLLLLIVVILFSCSFSLSANEQAYHILSFVDGVKQPVQSLNGAWQFRFAPTGKWETVQVPGELAMQGYAIIHDKPYTYLKTVTIPADFAGKRVILRFDGVYSQARLTINGKFVREHHGGFTRWETDVTDFVRTGRKNEIQVEITDRIDEISYASGYAHHPVGGILRDVTLFALPQAHLFDFYVETQLDTLYRDARLKIGYSAKNVDNELEIVYSLFDKTGVKANYSSIIKQDGDFVDMFDIKNPLKWDAEHPNLYTLNVLVKQKGKQISEFSLNAGFREVKIVGNRLLVNGRPVKLRGANRHDVHPVLGRTSTANMDSLDALLFKEANMNFVRTSHYPPSEKFVEYCNRYGIYVECETAVCFVETHRQRNYNPSNSQNDPAFTDRYLAQLHEMVKTFRSNPSILFWSIGNENEFGDNFRKSWDWVKATDTTRPVIFSYPGNQAEDNKVYNILSMHYPYIDGNLTQYGMTTVRFQGNGIPALFDEWAHPACYTYQTLQDDPNIREFWGQSIDMMWSNLFESPGGLGGAIWGFVDDVFMLPVPKVGTPWWQEFARRDRPQAFSGNCIGYGEWGIVDIWRRKKPEFWSTKKGYTPVKLLQEKVTDFMPGQRIILPVYNRFDHTILSEVKAYTVYKGTRKEIKLPSIEPHRRGLLEIAGERWENGEKLIIEFHTANNQLIDTYHIWIGEEKIELPRPVYQGGFTIEETDALVIVKGNGFEIPFSKETGLINNAKSGRQILIEKGPFLNMDVNLTRLTGAETRGGTRKYISSEADWKKTDFSCQQKDGYVLVYVAGIYKDVQIDLQINITPEGKITFDYTVSGEPDGLLRESGLKFYLADAIEHLQWKRNGYWCNYPANDFAGNEGEAPFYSNLQAPYGKPPTQPWHLDTHNYFYWADTGAGSSRPLTQAAKGMKENVYFYTLSTKEQQSLSVISSDASVACRTDRLTNEQLTLYVNNRWDYPEIAWGNYCKNIQITPCHGRITLLVK
jgi:hypothetical protein